MEQVSLKDFLKKAYGEYVDQEIAKAKDYRDKTYPARGWNPSYREGMGRFSPHSFARVDLGEGLERKVPVVENDNMPLGVAGRYTNPKIGQIVMSYDSPDEKIETMSDQRLRDLGSLLSRADVVEHEAGHIAYPAGSQEKLSRPQSSTEYGSYDMAIDHLTKPIEAINVLGRVNREWFKQTGARFDAESLASYIESESKKPEKSRYSGFSEDSRHMLEALRRSKKGEYDEEEKGSFFKEASKLIPALVKNDSEEGFLTSVEKRLA